MKRIENGWAAFALATGSAFLGFVLAASTLSFGTGEKVQNGNQEFISAPLNAMDPARLAELNQAERQRIEVFHEASKSVVFISVSQLQRSLFSLDVTEIPRGNGTGFIWDKQGHIVTNYHVVQSANRASVKLQSGEVFDAELVGFYKQKDLAVLKIKAPASKLAPIRLGTSKNLLEGQDVLAIGNPFGLDQTLTNGIVSALRREINSPVNTKILNVIQTNAAINPGNSGGPLLDSKGRVIGINTMILSPSSVNAGIGFAVPIDIVKKLVPQIIKYGRVEKPYHPVLGVEIDTESEEAHRIVRRYGILPVIIKNLSDDGGAKKAGIKEGDILVEAGGYRLRSIDDLRVVLERFDAGDVISLKYIRGNDVFKTTAKLDEEP